MEQQFSDLPENVVDQLVTILKKNPAELLPSEIELLKSRRDYLNNEQLEKFSTHLGGLPRGKKNKQSALPNQPAGTQYKQPTRAQAEPPTPPAQPDPPASTGDQQQSTPPAPTHQELVDEATSLNLELDGSETDEQLTEGIAEAKAEDIAKAEELGIDVTGLAPVEIMNAIADKVQANASSTQDQQEAAATVGTEDVTNGQSEEANPYGGSNADPDQQ